MALGFEFVECFEKQAAGPRLLTGFSGRYGRGGGVVTLVTVVVVLVFGSVRRDARGA